MNGQLELWNSTPEGWRKRMEQDAFEIAFPKERLGELDRVDLFLDFEEGQEGYAFSSWTFDEGSPPRFAIEVRWFEGRNWSRNNPANLRPLRHELKAKKVYENSEVQQFWLDLMRKGTR